MPCLKELSIVDVPKFIITSSSLQSGSLCSLRKLIFNPCSRNTSPWDDSAAFTGAADAIIAAAFPSLAEVFLHGKKVLKCLPQSLQHLTVLKSLLLTNFGIQELPEWIGNLSSLQELYIYSCTELRCLPSMEAMRRLSNLCYLKIDDYLILAERYVEERSDDNESEWPKISYLRRITIDRKTILKVGGSGISSL